MLANHMQIKGKSSQSHLGFNVIQITMINNRFHIKLILWSYAPCMHKHVLFKVLGQCSSHVTVLLSIAKKCHAMPACHSEKRYVFIGVQLSHVPQGNENRLFIAEYAPFLAWFNQTAFSFSKIFSGRFLL